MTTTKTKRSELRKGDTIAFYGRQEYANTVFTAKVIGFDQAAIMIQQPSGNEFWLNEWDLIKKIA